MHRIDNTTAASVLPAAGAVGPNPNGYFTKGNPGSGIPATIVDEAWANSVQEELCAVIESAGITLSKSSRNQLLQAIQALGFKSGDIKATTAISLESGWLVCDGSAVSRTTYAALYAAIGTTWGSGDGSTTFNLPDLRGRTAIGSGTYSKNETIATSAVNTGTDTITVASNDTYYTGQAVVYNNGGGTSITGLTSGNTYYVIRSSSTAIKLASSLANAVAGTAIDLTGTGNNSQYLTFSLTARSLGDVGGIETHALTTSEIPAHTHAAWLSFSTATYAAGAVGAWQNSGSVPNTASTGGSGAHMNMQPYAVLKFIIKT